MEEAPLALVIVAQLPGQGVERLSQFLHLVPGLEVHPDVEVALGDLFRLPAQFLKGHGQPPPEEPRQQQGRRQGEQGIAHGQPEQAAPHRIQTLQLGQHVQDVTGSSLSRHRHPDHQVVHILRGELPLLDLAPGQPGHRQGLGDLGAGRKAGWNAAGLDNPVGIDKDVVHVQEAAENLHRRPGQPGSLRRGTRFSGSGVVGEIPGKEFPLPVQVGRGLRKHHLAYDEIEGKSGDQREQNGQNQIGQDNFGADAAHPNH